MFLLCRCTPFHKCHDGYTEQETSSLRGYVSDPLMHRYAANTMVSANTLTTYSALKKGLLVMAGVQPANSKFGG